MSRKHYFLAALFALSAALVIFIAVADAPLDFAAFWAWLRQAPPEYLALAALLAPLVGVPLSPLLMSLAVVYPFWTAMAIAAGVIFVHHLLVLVLSWTRYSRWLQEKMRSKRLLPPCRALRSPSENALFILATTWIPGISYIFKPIYLVLSGISPKLYIVLGTLSQLLAALPYLLLGQVAENGGFFWFGVALFIVFGIAWLIKSHVLRRRMPDGNEAEK